MSGDRAVILCQLCNEHSGCVDSDARDAWQQQHDETCLSPFRTFPRPWLDGCAILNSMRRMNEVLRDETAVRKRSRMTTPRDRDITIDAAIAYGWDGGKARAFEALLPYVRHLPGCRTTPNADPHDNTCDCGLRDVWRIRETAP